MSSSLSVSSLAEVLGREELVLLDTRPIAAFNGWPLYGEARGGHIPEAKPFPRAWLAGTDDAALVALLERKGVDPDARLVVCGADSETGKWAARRLEELGYDGPNSLEGGALAWADDPGRPLEHLPRYESLVHPAWLARELRERRERRDEGGAKRFVLAHVNFDDRGDYERGHVPGAIHLDTLALEEPERWNRRSPEELEAALCSQGITHDTLVVLYGRTGRPDMSQEHPGREAGQIAAMRAAMLLMYAGVRDVRVLDGGLNAWESEGHSLAREQARAEPVRDFGAPIPSRPELMIDVDEARRLLEDPGGALVSVRSWAEYIGEVSGYHYVKPKGRIPGAVFGNCGSDAYHMQNYRNHDETMRDYREIAENWRAVGVTPDKQVAFYCGTGWRASEACFCAHLMAWERAAVYDGGWFDWSIDEENPLERGVPAEAPPAFR